MTRLLRALLLSAKQYDLAITLESLSETPWESATFSGAIHHIAASADGSSACEAWLHALHEIDLPVPGHFVADVIVTERTHAGCTIVVQTIAQ